MNQHGDVFEELVLGSPVVCAPLESLAAKFRLGDYSAVFVLCDQNTKKHCWPILRTRISDLDVRVEPIVMPAGESTKTLETCRDVWRSLVDLGADRQSLLINLGGGVVTDLGGFCAAAFMRGIAFAHLPTTVLGMTDAAIGGKHGVDFDGLKNYIGLFADPVFVQIDTAFLKTLPERQIRNGLAEIIKHGAIGDPGLLTMIRKAGSLQLDWDNILHRSIRVKKHFVADDPRDRSARAALNFGHTIGHAIETAQLFTASPLLHGEAVALGMLVETALSRECCGLLAADADDLSGAIRTIFPDLVLPDVQADTLKKLVEKDKKVRRGQLHFTLLERIGKPLVQYSVDADRVVRVYAECRKR